jgi:fucose 4-O-acetylase-like acetyltransferase
MTGEANNTSESKERNPDRVWFMDYARWWLVLIVFLFHSTYSQTAFSEGQTVSDPRKLPVANVFVLACYMFQMPLLFFISGFFALPSLRPRGFWRFCLAKVYRLIIPAFVVLLLLNPIRRYLFHCFQEQLVFPPGCSGTNMALDCSNRPSDLLVRCPRTS